MDPRRFLPAALLLAAPACAAPAPPPPPPPATAAVPPAPPPGATLRDLARAARAAVEARLGRPVPEEAAEPVVADREAMEAALAEELRPQVDRLHPEASPGARETLLRATARSSAAGVVARWSPARRRILFSPENVGPALGAAGLAREEGTERAFALLVLAHEMVHAADDAERGLADLYLSAPDAEALRARGMLVEGRAVLYARETAPVLGVPPEVAAVLPAERGPLDERRARFLLSYREGAAFAADLERRGGAALAARALRDPPRRTSTLFHPSRYGPRGEEGAPDLGEALRAAGFPSAGEASELDLRARWLPRLGEEAVRGAFAGFRAGAGLHRPDGGVSVSLHDTEEAAAAYADALRSLYGLPPGTEEGTREGLALAVLLRGRAVGSAVGPDPSLARREAERALAAAVRP